MPSCYAVYPSCLCWLSVCAQSSCLRIVQAATAEALADLEVHGISTPPKQRVDASELATAAADPAAAEALFERLREASGGTSMQCSFLIPNPCSTGKAVRGISCCIWQELCAT